MILQYKDSRLACMKYTGDNLYGCPQFTFLNLCDIPVSVIPHKFIRTITFHR